MGKTDKYYEARMSGMLYALTIAEKEGIEGLEKEIRMRGITKMPVNVPTEFVKEQWHEVVENLYINVITCALYALHEKFEFGQKRIKEFKDEYDKQIKNAVDLDYLGEHYVKISDYAKWLNEQYDLGIDSSRLDYTQGTYDVKDENYHTCKVEKVIEMLQRYGQDEAAKIIGQCIGEQENE